MIIIKVLGICACTLLVVILLKDKAQAFIPIVTIVGVCCVLLIVIDGFRDIIDTINNISNDLNGVMGYIKIMVKVLGVSLLAQLVSDLCKDNGQASLATATEIAAKITIITLILPLFETIITIVNGLVK